MNQEPAGFHEAALLHMVQDRGGLDLLASSNQDLGNLLRDYGIGVGVGVGTEIGEDD